MIKRVLMFVSGFQQSVLVDFMSQMSQNKAKIYIKSSLVKIVFIKSFLTKTNKFTHISFF